MELNQAYGDDLMNEAEAAAFLRMRSQTLANWRCTGRYGLPYIRIGSRAVRYRRADLIRFLDDRTIGQPVESA